MALIESLLARLRPQGVTRVIVAKNRSGPIGDVDLIFVPASTKFYELNEHAEE